MHPSTIWKGFLLAVSILLILFVPLSQGTAAPQEHTFHIHAGRFEYAPAVIQVKPGDRVTIELTATDVVHGLAIDGYSLSMTADPGQTERLSFIADRAGVFRFRCSVTCGNLHPFMIGKLVVGSNLLFWRLSGLAVLAALFITAKLWFRK